MDPNDQDAAAKILDEINEGIGLLYDRCIAQRALLNEILGTIVKGKRKGLWKELPGSRVRGWVQRYKEVEGITDETEIGG